MRLDLAESLWSDHAQIRYPVDDQLLVHDSHAEVWMSTPQLPHRGEAENPSTKHDHVE